MRSKIVKITTGNTAQVYQELLGNLTYGEPHEFIGGGLS